MSVGSPRLGTGKARSGFGAKPEKQFLFWDLRSKKAIGSGCNPGGASCRMRLDMSNRVQEDQIPNTQNCYSFIGIISYPEAEPGLVITLGKPGRVQRAGYFPNRRTRDKRYNPKKVRRAWGISQVIIDLILNWFLKNTQRQTRGSTELLFKNLLYDVHKEKVWRS